MALTPRNSPLCTEYPGAPLSKQMSEQSRTPPLPGKFVPTKQGSAEVVLFEHVLDGICDHRIELQSLAPHPGCVRFVELVFLGLLMRHLRPRRVFEFGTLQGRTTLNLALNLPVDSQILTLNLRVEDQEQFDGWHKQDELLVKENRGKIGRLFRESEVAQKITQLWGDSLTIRLDQYRGAMDLVFIDGNRQYDYVKSDSKNAARMLRPGGLIVWHDYNYADSVTEAVDDFCRENAFPCKTVSQLTIALAFT
jgi:predicted O-methyltransferase YrrM